MVGLIPSSILEGEDELSDVDSASEPELVSHAPAPVTKPREGLVTEIAHVLSQHQQDMAAREAEWERRQEAREEASERRLATLIASLKRKRPPAQVVPTPIATPTVVARPQDTEQPPEEEGEIPGEEELLPHESEEEDGQLPDEDWVDIPKERPIFVPIPSPPDDPAQFVGLLSRAAAKFQITLPQEEEPASFLMDKLSPAMKTVTHIPVDPLIWKKGLDLMKTPATVPATAPRQEKKYHATSKDPMCLRGIPPPDSVIVSTAIRKGSTAATISAASVPNDKEHRLLDAVGKKVCTTASLAVRAANTTAVLARYDRDLWDGWEDLLPFLPEDKRQAAENPLTEGRVCANHTLKAAMDSAYSGFRSMAHGVALRRHGWLSASGFPQEVRRSILNLPFNGETLFGTPVDEAMKGMKEHMEQAKAMTGLHSSQQQQRPFRGRGARGKGGSASSSSQDRRWQTTASRGKYTPYPQQRGGRGRGSGGGSRPGKSTTTK